MYLDNVVGYSTSKSVDEILLTGDFENTEKKLNGRVKFISSKGTVVWIDKEIVETLSNTDFLSELKVPEDDKTVNHLTVSEAETKVEETIYHTVKRGETFQSIATHYGISESTLRGANVAQTFCIGARLLIKRGN